VVSAVDAYYRNIGFLDRSTTSPGQLILIADCTATVVPSVRAHSELQCLLRVCPSEDEETGTKINGNRHEENCEFSLSSILSCSFARHFSLLTLLRKKNT
jgi:hypothetical protein